MEWFDDFAGHQMLVYISTFIRCGLEWTCNFAL